MDYHKEGDEGGKPGVLLGGTAGWGGLFCVVERQDGLKGEGPEQGGLDDNEDGAGLPR